MIRNFGTVIDDDAVRSLVLSTRLLGTKEIMIINHTDCGMLRSHPWIAPDIPVRGFVYDVSTGRLSEVLPDREAVIS
jgi:carbonic anhydrase